MGFPSVSDGKDPPTMQESLVQSLDREDPLEKGMTTHSSILAWEIPWTEKLNGLHIVHGDHRELDMTERLTLALSQINRISGRDKCQEEK